MKKIILFLFVLCSVNLGAQTLRGPNGLSIGSIESNGTVRGSNGLSIGKVEKDGTVRGSNGLSIGKIENDGTVRGSNGLSIGSAKGVPKTWAAAAFFFFEFE